MEKYKVISRTCRRAAPQEQRLQEKAKALCRTHGGLVLAAESAAVVLGAAGLVSMLCGV